MNGNFEAGVGPAEGAECRRLSIHAPFACQCGGALTEGCRGWPEGDPIPSRREATCQCCRRNDAPQGETVCTSCRGYAVRLTKAEARLLMKLLTMHVDYPELEPDHQALYDKLGVVL